MRELGSLIPVFYQNARLPLALLHFAYIAVATLGRLWYKLVKSDGLEEGCS